MPLPNIVTNGLIGYWHPGKFDRRLPGKALSLPITTWRGLTGIDLNAVGINTVNLFSGCGTIKDPYGIYFNGSMELNPGATSGSKVIPAWTICVWYKTSIEEINNIQRNLFKIGTYDVYNYDFIYYDVFIDTAGYLKYYNSTSSISIADGNIHLLTFNQYSLGTVYFDAYLDTTKIVPCSQGPRKNVWDAVYLQRAFWNFVGTVYAIFIYGATYSKSGGLPFSSITQNYQAGYLMRGWGSNTVLTGAMATEVLNSLSDKMNYMTFIKGTFEETSRVAVNLTNNIDLTNMLLTINCKGSDVGTNFPIDIIGANFYKDGTSTSPTLTYLFDTITFNSSTDTHNLFIQLEVK